MITNLFSIFDPTSRIFNLSINWISSIIRILIIPSIYWIIPSRINYLWNKILISLHKEFKILLKNKNINGSTLIFTSLFSIIFFNNFIGLFPYIFTRTRHLSLTLSIAFPLWLSFILYGWINYSQHIFIHLVPQGTPSILIPFIVCIESIRNIIRPITLAIRLTANIIAGHLLLTLLGNNGPSINLFFLNILIISQIILLTLERAVAIIQSYVFSVLRTLYSREVN